MKALNKVLQLNLFGTLLPKQFFEKIIAQQKSGSIVNISSASATRAITRALGKAWESLLLIVILAASRLNWQTDMEMSSE